jgi:ATP-dependent Zn protease
VDQVDIRVLTGDLRDQPVHEHLAVLAIFQLPALLWTAMPFVAQLAFAFFFVIFQFVGLFWFLSRGGIDTYFPDDIKTRFTDVWGQDHVLARVKENIVFLERPQEIEARAAMSPVDCCCGDPRAPARR